MTLAKLYKKKLHNSFYIQEYCRYVRIAVVKSNFNVPAWRLLLFLDMEWRTSTRYKQ